MDAKWHYDISNEIYEWTLGITEAWDTLPACSQNVFKLWFNWCDSSQEFFVFELISKKIF